MDGTSVCRTCPWAATTQLWQGKRWRDKPFSCIGRVNIIKMPHSPKACYRYHATQNPTRPFSVERDKPILKFMWKNKGYGTKRYVTFLVVLSARIAEKQPADSCDRILRFSTRLWESRQRGTGERTNVKVNGTVVSPQTDPYIHMATWSLTKRSRWFKGEKIVSNTWCWKRGTSTYRKENLDPYLASDKRSRKDLRINKNGYTEAKGVHYH